MNTKNILKVLAITACLVFVILAGLFFWGLSKLPSAFEIKQKVTPPAFADVSPAPRQPVPEQVAQTPANEELPAKQETASTPNKDEKLKADTIKILQDDFTDERKPMVDTCRIMEKSEHSHFLKDKNNASARYFFSHLQEDTRDPLSETAAPIFRQIFRTPGMQQLVEMIVQAETNKDDGLLKKAEFYYQIYKAGTALRENVDEMNQVLQQSYNMHNLMKAVALKPEIAKSPDTLHFCEEMEKALNTGANVDPEYGAKEMQSFLSSHGINPTDIGYDPNYRSKIELNISNTQVSLNDSWIAQIFASDIEKALQQRKNSQ